MRPITRPRPTTKNLRSCKENVAHFVYSVHVDEIMMNVCFRAFLGLYETTQKHVHRLRILAIRKKSPQDDRSKVMKTNVLFPDVVEKIKEIFSASQYVIRISRMFSFCRKSWTLIPCIICFV